METGFDNDLLFDELNDLQMEDIKLEDFGFNIDKAFDEAFIDTNAVKTQKVIDKYFNTEKALYKGVGKYDIPQIKSVKKIGKIKEWIGFNYVLSDKNPEEKAVHFFLHDYQFERIWNEPDKYIPKLRQYVCVTAPDFSPFGDMPYVLQLYNHYRKHWVARYMQENGVTVIPTITYGNCNKSYEYYLMGEPKNGIIALSSMWTSGKEKDFEKRYKNTINTLKPRKVFVYGKTYDFMGNVEQIKTFSDKWKE